MVPGPRVRIVQLTAPALAALAAGDLSSADLHSPVPLTPWLASTENGWTWGYRARQVLDHPADLPWVTGVVWDLDAGRAVGRAGFHGAPHDGLVEVGYAIDPAHRRRGYARAALELMITRARQDPAVRILRASVSPENTASLALVAQYPFVEVGEQWDDEDGLEIRYEMAVASMCFRDWLPVTPVP